MNNNKTILIAGLAFVIGGLAVFALTQLCERHERYENNNKSMHGMHTMHDGSVMKNSDTRMGAQNMHDMDHMGMMVKSEREFLTSMIPHHEEAVRTAQEVLERGGTTPEIKSLVQNIIAAQEKEIASMKAWHEAWYGEAYSDTGTYTNMMRDLRNLSGIELDKVFLEDMVMHHMGAIMMAQSIAPYITHSELTQLTKAIITSQTAEIEMMQTLRKGL